MSLLISARTERMTHNKENESKVYYPMEDLREETEALNSNVERALDKLDLPKKQRELEELESRMQAEDFWQDNQQAAAVASQHSHLQTQIKTWQTLAKETKDLAELAKVGDAKMEAELAKSYQALKPRFEAAEFELKLSGPYDQHNALLSIHAGTGGTDAMDWAQILERMYLRWAESQSYRAEVVSETASEEAGIKNATLKIDGLLAYGKLKGEYGVHRLVRRSPFNADHLRQTSFALVEVLPELEEAEIEIDPKDIKVDVFRSSGAGGQSVNKTASAVRVTHLPTNISVSIQNERSQTQNRQTAMKILAAKLQRLAEEQQQAAISKLKGNFAKAEWGQQIRNYVLDPYKLVKDLRSGFETTEVEKVLGGDLDGFIEAYLAKQIGESR